MQMFLLTLDEEDAPTHVVMAEDAASAADLYVTAILAGDTQISLFMLRKTICMWVDEYTPQSAPGVVAMKVSTTVPMKSIPSYMAAKNSEF